MKSISAIKLSSGLVVQFINSLPLEDFVMKHRNTPEYIEQIHNLLYQALEEIDMLPPELYLNQDRRRVQIYHTGLEFYSDFENFVYGGDQKALRVLIELVAGGSGAQAPDIQEEKRFFEAVALK